MKFFAYDDKMFTPQLQAILRHHVVCLGRASLRGYRLLFHNQSQDDRSGKCNLMRSQIPSDVVHGVLYDIPTREKHILDKASLLGFGNQEITVKVDTVVETPAAIVQPTASCYAFTYIAHRENVHDDLKPFTWYKALVLKGAVEHQLPKEYIQFLETVMAAPDPDLARAQAHERLLANKSAN